MGRSKRTYALPQDTVEEFEQEVRQGKRSTVIAELIKDWLDRKRREKRRRGVIEGCREMAEVYLDIEQEYHPLEEEAHRVLDPKSKTWRCRPDSTRSRRRV